VSPVVDFVLEKISYTSAKTSHTNDIVTAFGAAARLASRHCQCHTFWWVMLNC